MENDFTKEVLQELDKVIDYAREEGYQVEDRFRSDYFNRLAMFWLYGDVGYMQIGFLEAHNLAELINSREAKCERHRVLIALANICLEIDQHEHNQSIGRMKVIAERSRQVSKNRTTSRDKYLYKGDELKRFAMHRLTGELRFYPLDNPSWSNLIKNPDYLTRHVQAGALLLAHIQKEFSPGVSEDEISNYVQTVKPQA